MKVRYQYKNLSEKEQALFEEYISSKISAIEALLTHFAEDAVMLESRVEKFDKHDAFEVELILKMPMKSIQACETSHTITKAVDLSKDRLIVQIKKILSSLRKEQLNARRHSSIRRPAVHEATDIEAVITKEFLEA